MVVVVVKNEEEEEEEEDGEEKEERGMAGRGRRRKYGTQMSRAPHRMKHFLKVKLQSWYKF